MATCLLTPRPLSKYISLHYARPIAACGLETPKHPLPPPTPPHPSHPPGHPDCLLGVFECEGADKTLVLGQTSGFPIKRHRIKEEEEGLCWRSCRKERERERKKKKKKKSLDVCLNNDLHCHAPCHCHTGLQSKYRNTSDWLPKAFFFFPRLGTTDSEMKVSFAERTKTYRRFCLQKPSVGHGAALRARVANSQEFDLSSFCLSESFVFIFSKSSCGKCHVS